MAAKAKKPVKYRSKQHTIAVTKGDGGEIIATAADKNHPSGAAKGSGVNITADELKRNYTRVPANGGGGAVKRTRK